MLGSAMPEDCQQNVARSPVYMSEAGICWDAQELFKEKHYTDLDGGILEGFGRLLKYDLKLYVYPTKDDKTGQLVTADTLKVRIAEQPICQAGYAE